MRAPNQLPVIFHTGTPPYAQPFQVVQWAEAYPDVPIILAHFASYSSQQPGIWFHNAVETMQQCKNVYVDISAAHYLFDDEENIRIIREKAGFGQVLFATDYPGPLHYGQTLETVQAHARPSDGVLFYGPWQVIPFQYYNPG